MNSMPFAIAGTKKCVSAKFTMDSIEQSPEKANRSVRGQQYQ